MEGCIVGSNVGCAEGMKVAVAAGLAVGDGVGATVGAPVGIALPPGTRTNPIPMASGYFFVNSVHSSRLITPSWFLSAL